MENFEPPKRIWVQRFLVAATPAVCYLLFEWTTGNLLQVYFEFAVVNLLFYYTIYFLLLAFFRHMRPVYLILNVLLIGLAVAENYVVGFRNRPIMIWDILAIRTAATVAGTYNYAMSWHQISGISLMAVWCVLIWLFPLSLPKGRIRLILATVAASWAVVLNVFFFLVLVPFRSIEVNMWNPLESYETQGYLLCTIRMIGYMSVEKPDEYDHVKVSQLYEELETTAAQEGTVPVNIICIMNESWSDLSVIAPFETNLPLFDNYNAINDNSIKGKVYVPVFGSMTSNTEFEFLTGNSMAFAPAGSVPFQIYMGEHSISMLDTLKQYGYYTIGMHPYPAANWNRNGAYESMGFDEFLAEEYFEDSARLRGYVSDQGSYDEIIKITEENDGEQPLFFFLVTMQNHGGYALGYETVHLTEYEGFLETQEYLSLIRETDIALGNLIAYYRDSDQPTLIMMFGDHQPSVEEQFYEALYGESLLKLQPEYYLRRYMTPYIIWTNYENNLEEQGDFSVLYLYNQVLKAANLPLNGYETFLEELKEEAPVIHMMGYYDSDWNWESWTGWRQKESYPWMQRLDWYQYYRMFDKKRK